MCLFDSNFTDPVPINCGKATDITWQFSSIDPNQFTITYLDGDITEPSQFNRLAVLQYYNYPENLAVYYSCALNLKFASLAIAK